MRKDVPVLLVEDDRIGVSGYIIKPVDFHKFIETIEIINFYWSLSEVP